MGQIDESFTLNTTILKQCREQVGLSLDNVKNKVLSIKEIEGGRKRPTYRQLEILADLYAVPRWVFMSEELPETYTYSNKPSFRALKGKKPFNYPKIRRLITQVEYYRDLLIELKQDLKEPIESFNPPDMKDNLSPTIVAQIIRNWLELDKPLNFEDLKKKLEAKDIFIFLTSKYKGWSHIDPSIFRGLCLWNETMPIIVINSSDAHKAQSFTFMHELGHLLKNKHAINDWQTDGEEEKWCNELAGNILMPIEQLEESLQNRALHHTRDIDLAAIGSIAKGFKVSIYACLVRMRQTGKIEARQYKEFEDNLKGEYERKKSAQKEKPGWPSRNRTKEIRDEFGQPFVNTILSAWQEKNINLLQARQILGLKKTKHLLELRK